MPLSQVHTTGGRRRPFFLLAFLYDSGILGTCEQGLSTASLSMGSRITESGLHGLT